MHILANVGPKVHILFRLIFSSESATFLDMTKMTKCDMGEGGQKISVFLSDILFEWPFPLSYPQRQLWDHKIVSHTLQMCPLYRKYFQQNLTGKLQNWGKILVFFIEIVRLSTLQCVRLREISLYYVRITMMQCKVKIKRDGLVLRINVTFDSKFVQSRKTAGSDHRVPTATGSNCEQQTDSWTLF